jgi:putative ABC transport system permease protein
MLTLAGIVLGVGVFVGMHTANQSVMAAFNETIIQIAGRTQLQITAGESGFDEEVLEKVQSLPQVKAAAPLVEATVSTASGNVLIMGVDMLGDRNLRSYDLEGGDESIDDPLVFLAQPDSLIVTGTFAAKNQLKLNSTLPMRTMNGDLQFAVRGIMKPGGLASAFGGDLAVMDIYAAQKFLGRGRKFDRIDVALDDNVTLEDATAKLSELLGPGFEIQAPASRGQQFEQTSRMYSIGSNITSVFALVIGMFIIYSTFAIAVTQRRSEIGILRALGATRAQIRDLFLVESAVSGMVGSALGVVFGVALARAMAGYLGAILGDVYGVPTHVDGISPSSTLLIGALVMGIITSLIAGVIPARAAAGVDPLLALQKGRVQSFSSQESRGRAWVAALTALGSVIALICGENNIVFYAGFVLAVGTAVLLSPYMSYLLATALRPILARIRPVEGALAADSLIQSPRRTSGAIAALMLSLSLLIAMGGLARASFTRINEWVRIALNPDLFVTTAQTVTSRTFVFPASLGDGLRQIPGVAEVQPVRTVRLNVKGGPVMLMSIDLKGLERRAKLPAIQGNEATMYAQAAIGQAVLVSEGFARLHDVKLGETLEIPAPGAPLRLPVVGIVRDFTDQQGSILISRELYTKAWSDDKVNLFRVYLAPGADPTATRQKILDAYGNTQRLFVLTNADVRGFISNITNQWFGLTYLQIAIAMLVAILGIVNALTVSITDRRRELGVLQAVGGLRNQIRHTIWMEAGAIGIIGVILGLALGAITLFYATGIAKRDLIGIEIGYEYPLGMLSFLVPVILGCSWLAALGPASSAVRGSLVEALEYE